MRKVLFFLFTYAFTFIFWSCSKTDNAVGPAVQGATGNYFPLAVGDQWTYHTWFDSSGVKEPGSDNTGAIAIVNTKSLDGYIAYGVGAPGYDTAVGYYALDARGNFWMWMDTSMGGGSGTWIAQTNFSNTMIGHTDTLLWPINFALGGIIDTSVHQWDRCWKRTWGKQ